MKGGKKTHVTQSDTETHKLPRGIQEQAEQRNKLVLGSSWSELSLTHLLRYKDIFFSESLALYKFLEFFHGLWVFPTVSPCGERAGEQGSSNAELCREPVTESRALRLPTWSCEDKEEEDLGRDILLWDEDSQTLRDPDSPL